MKKILALIICLVAVAAIYLMIMCLSKYESRALATIYIPKDATSESVGDSLTKALGNAVGEKVYSLWRLSGGDASASHGYYEVHPQDRVISIAHKIKKGRQTPINVTLNNMRTLNDLVSKLNAKFEASASEFNEAINDLLNQGKGYTSLAQLPAAFVPDTYQFYWTDSPKRVVEKLVDERNNFWTAERRVKASEMGLTPVEVATVASIVEEESNNKDERPMIARLYLNRLNKNMKLQADPTVKFAVGDFTIRRITQVHLTKESPYNTYRVNGLPPGPIRIVEKATLDAVLNAPQHSFLYMCAKEDFSGRHNFAEDYKTHLQNARRYQAALDSRGIK